MILDKNNNQEHELYVKAISALNKQNKVSDHVKQPETREEQEFMRETDKACSSSSFGFTSVNEKQWNMIFRGLKEEHEMDRVSASRIAGVTPGTNGNV